LPRSTFKIGTSTVYRYVREAIDLLAAMLELRVDAEASRQ
jgi:hypothetical protein